MVYISCLLRLLCVFFCRVFSVHSSTYLLYCTLTYSTTTTMSTSLFAVAALCLIIILIFLSCFLGSLQYFLSKHIQVTRRNYNLQARLPKKLLVSVLGHLFYNMNITDVFPLSRQDQEAGGACFACICPRMNTG